MKYYAEQWVVLEEHPLEALKLLNNCAVVLQHALPALGYATPLNA